MNVTQFNISILLVVCLASPVFSGNDASSIASLEAAAVKNFVKKTEGVLIDVIQTTDGYVSINSTVFGLHVVTKFSASGRRIWERELVFHFPDRVRVALSRIAQTDHGYVLVGYTVQDYEYINRLFIVGLNTDGTVEWNKTFDIGHNFVPDIFFDSVNSSQDGGFIVTGHTYQPYSSILVKFTSSGDALWSKRFNKLDISYSQQVSDGLIIAAYDAIIKVNDSGNIVWKKALKIENFAVESLGPASDNGVVIAGELVGDPSSLLLIGLNAEGEVDWEAAYSLSVYYFRIYDLAQTSDGGYVITGAYFAFQDAASQGLFLKINAKHDLVFQTTFGVSGTYEVGQSVFDRTKGGYIVFGSSELVRSRPPFRPPYMLVLSLNADGVVPGCRFFHELTINRIPAPTVTTKKVEITTRPFSLPIAGTIQIDSVVSKTRSSNKCP